MKPTKKALRAAQKVYLYILGNEGLKVGSLDKEELAIYLDSFARNYNRKKIKPNENS